MPLGNVTASENVTLIDVTMDRWAAPLLITIALTVGGATPKVGAARMEEGASKGAEGPDQLAGIGALKSGPGKLQEKLLERLVRLRRIAGTRVSAVGCQWRTNRLAKRLKTLGL